jgi:hypothetical protein
MQIKQTIRIETDLKNKNKKQIRSVFYLRYNQTLEKFLVQIKI